MDFFNELFGSSDVTQVGMLVGAVGTLATVIGILYRQVLRQFDSVNDRLDEAQKALSDCLDDRLQLWKTLAEQAGRSVEELQRRDRA